MFYRNFPLIFPTLLRPKSATNWENSFVQTAVPNNNNWILNSKQVKCLISTRKLLPTAFRKISGIISDHNFIDSPNLLFNLKKKP